MKYIIFVDCDGTLLNDQSDVTPRAKVAIKNLMESGCLVVIASGRPRYSANWIKEKAGASTYLISSNGAEVYDYEKGKVLLQNVLSKTTCLDICNHAINAGARIVMVSGNYEYVTQVSHSKYQIIVENYQDIALNKDVKQIFITGSDFEAMNNLRNYVLSLEDVRIVNESVCFKANDPMEKEQFWFSVASKTTSKGQALEFLANYLNIPKENIYAFGNDYNDVSMFTYASISICPENADEEIKQMVDIVTSNNNDEGAAKIFEEIMENIKLC